MNHTFSLLAFLNRVIEYNIIRKPYPIKIAKSGDTILIIDA